MTEALMDPAMEITMEAAPSPSSPRGRRPGKRKSYFVMSCPPWPVRAIWEQASPEERQEAHLKGILMMEHWLGRTSRKQLAHQMQLPPLRVWQMSQQALAGMVVGLMAQPKRPPKGSLMPSESKKDQTAELKELRKKVANLENDNRVLKELLDVLKDMPEHPATPSAPKGKKISPSTPNPLKQDRSLAPQSRPKEG